VNERKGLIQVYTGDGKGKTTAAVGQAIRALGRGFKVMIVQWLKDGRSGEIPVLKKLGIEVVVWGGEYGKKMIAGIPLRDIHTIQKESESFLHKITEKIRNYHYDLVIFDEINVALKSRLIDREKFLSWLRNKPDFLEVILTGREASPEILSQADLVTEMKKIKHPYDKGTKMRKGVEY